MQESAGARTTIAYDLSTQRTELLAIYIYKIPKREIEERVDDWTSTSGL
jgi:ABC-type uncharacterized transport system ATPase subunit